MLRFAISLCPVLLCLACCGQKEQKCPEPPASEVPPSSPEFPSFEIPRVSLPVLDRDLANRLSELPLSCIPRSYPNKPGHVYAEDAEAVPHRQKTPVFHGCFDWHSSVHMHWTLVRLLRVVPDLPRRPEIVKLLNDQFTPEKVATEVAFFNTPHNRTFERIYGWAWLLRLQGELMLSGEDEAHRWRETLAPLASMIRDRSIVFLEKLPKPVRPGTHQNTAFGMDHLWKYAKAADDRELLEVLRRQATFFFGQDAACPVSWEPSGVDFISPCLAEAHLMSSVLEQEEFVAWLDRFLPDPHTEAFSSLRTPPVITDLQDYVIGHLVGLNFQRAWAYLELAARLPEKDRRRNAFRQLGALHLAEGLKDMNRTGYGGEHWLASFAVNALTFDAR